MVFVETYLFDGDARHPAGAKVVGGGSMTALVPGRGIVAHREPGGVLHTYMQLARDRAWADAADLADPSAVVRRVAEEFEGVGAGADRPRHRRGHRPGRTPPARLPAGHRWARVPGVALLGDAAHLVPPSGEGANLALPDGAGLGEALAAPPGDVEAALAAYEAALFPRGARTAADAEKVLTLCVGGRAPCGLIEMFAGADG